MHIHNVYNHFHVLFLSGEFRMEKVKVTRYMPGRRPDYARDSSSSSSSSEDEDEGEEEEGKVREEEQVEENRREYGDEEVARDRRLARLRERTTHVERYVNIHVHVSTRMLRNQLL